MAKTVPESSVDEAAAPPPGWDGDQGVSSHLSGPRWFWRPRQQGCSPEGGVVVKLGGLCVAAGERGRLRADTWGPGLGGWEVELGGDRVAEAARCEAAWNLPPSVPHPSAFLDLGWLRPHLFLVSLARG